MKISHNKILFYTIVFLLVLLIIVLFLAYHPMMQNQEPECLTDQDCTIQQTTCCPCNMGGEEVCIAKQNTTTYQEKLDQCQEDIACIALYNCKIQSCLCREGRCTEN